MRKRQINSESERLPACDWRVWAEPVRLGEGEWEEEVSKRPSKDGVPASACPEVTAHPRRPLFGGQDPDTAPGGSCLCARAASDGAGRGEAGGRRVAAHDQRDGRWRVRHRRGRRQSVRGAPERAAQGLRAGAHRAPVRVPLRRLGPAVLRLHHRPGHGGRGRGHAAHRRPQDLPGPGMRATLHGACCTMRPHPHPSRTALCTIPVSPKTAPPRPTPHRPAPSCPTPLHRGSRVFSGLGGQ